MPYDPKRHGRVRIVGPGFHERVYRCVCKVPAGSVTCYGDVAEQLGSRSVARHVGNALAGLPATRREVPWHRVVSSRGKLSPRTGGGFSVDQRLLLEAEGVVVDDAGTVVDFARLRHCFR